MPFNDTFFDRGRSYGPLCMLLWLFWLPLPQARAAQCSQQSQPALHPLFSPQPGGWVSASPKATSAPPASRNWPWRNWRAPREWKAWIKAIAYALVFAFGVALWWGFLGIAVGLALSGFIGFGLTLLIFVLGGASATWLASGVFHRLAGIERRGHKWLSRGIHLLLLFGLGLLVGYTWGVLLSALAIWLIAGMLLAFGLVSWGVFHAIAQANP